MLTPLPFDTAPLPRRYDSLDGPLAQDSRPRAHRPLHGLPVRGRDGEGPVCQEAAPRHRDRSQDRPGIYDVTWFQPSLRLIVLSQTETKPENALWQLFSGRPDRVADAARTYRFRRRDLSTVVNSLFEAYGLEGLTMPYTVTDYLKEEALRLRDILTPAERLEGLDPEEIEAYLRKIRSGPQ